MLDASALSALRDLYEHVMRRAETLPPHYEFTYLFGEAEQNQISQFNAAPAFISPIGIIAHEESPGFTGFSVWKKALLERGIHVSRIVPIESALRAPDGTIISNTVTESRGLIAYASEHGLKDVCIVAPRFHIVRCLMSSVGAALTSNADVRLHPAFGCDLPWGEDAVHSQGRERGKRVDFFFGEATKVIEYMLLNDLPDPQTVIEYLKRI
jgi:hypothetical protein